LVSLEKPLQNKDSEQNKKLLKLEYKKKSDVIIWFFYFQQYIVHELGLQIGAPA
jgi:hypothetical protein